MSEVRTFKDIEIKLHEELHKNLYLLTSIYKTSQEFDRVFKKDMFVKNNKAAFYEVVYYLLDILNAEVTKEKLKSWRPYDIKKENQFRTELLKYINELNHHYTHANIPPIMSSHLISPGGFKFTKFMLKLSQLAIYEHLKKSGALLLYCPVPNKNPTVTRAMCDALNKITLEIKLRTKLKIEKFQEKCDVQKTMADNLSKSLSELDKSISAAKKDQLAAEEELFKKYTVYPSISSLKEKLVDLNTLWNKLSNIQKLFQGCKNIQNYLSSNDLVLQHSLNTQISTDSPQGNKLDLPDFFYTFASLMNSKSLELPNPNSLDIIHNIENIKSISVEYTQIYNEINIDKQQVCDEVKDLLESLKFIENFVSLQSRNHEADFLEDTLGIEPFDDSA